MKGLGGKGGGLGKRKGPEKTISLGELNSPFLGSLRNDIANQPQIQQQQTVDPLNQGMAQAPAQPLEDREEVTNPMLEQMIKHFSTNKDEFADGEMGEMLREEGY